MAFRLSVNGENRACSNFVTTIDAGGTTTSAGQVLIYSGAQPATPGTAASGTLLATVPLNNPSFSAPSGGTATMITSPAVTSTVTTTGTAGWFRVVDRGGNAVFDGAIGTSGSDMNFDNTNLVATAPITITSMTVSFPM